MDSAVTPLPIVDPFAALGNRCPSEAQRILIEESITKESSKASLLSEQLARIEQDLEETASSLTECQRLLEGEVSLSVMADYYVRHYQNLLSTHQEAQIQKDKTGISFAYPSRNDAVDKIRRIGNDMKEDIKRAVDSATLASRDAAETVAIAEENVRLAEMKLLILKEDHRMTTDQLEYLNNAIAKKRQYLTAIRRVPPELWQEIFRYVIQAKIAPTSKSLESQRRQPVCTAYTLGGVCQSWRLICEGTPRLWTTVTVHSEAPKFLVNQAVLACIKKSEGVIHHVNIISIGTLEILPIGSLEALSTVKILESMDLFIKAEALNRWCTLTIPYFFGCHHIIAHRVGRSLGTPLFISLFKEALSGLHSLAIHRGLPYFADEWQNAGNVDLGYYKHEVEDLAEYVMDKALELTSIRVAVRAGHALPSAEITLSALEVISGSMETIMSLFNSFVIIPKLWRLETKAKAFNPERLRQWQDFLRVNNGGINIKEIVLLPTKRGNISIILPFLECLHGVKSLELRQSNIEPFLKSLIHDMEDISKNTPIYPSLERLVITDYHGNGRVVAEFVRIRNSNYDRSSFGSNLSDNDTRKASNTRISTVEWRNCSNVLPVTRWGIFTLCRRHVLYLFKSSNLRPE
jgi:hypothetical protein